MEQIVNRIQEDQGGGQIIGCCQRAGACCGEWRLSRRSTASPVDASYIAPRLSVGKHRETTRWERRIRGTEVLITWFPLGNCRIWFENWGRSPWWLPEYTIPIS